MSENVASAEKKTIPLQEGMFAQGSDGKYHLLACRCNSCKLIFFPKRKYCGKCGSPDVEVINLSDRGKVFSFTQIDRKSMYTIIEPPYMQVEVEMPEGVHVFTVLDKCDPKTVDFGMEVEVYVDTVKQDEQGNDIIAYKFKPVA
jgi:uncharacterized OB-fold protein